MKKILTAIALFALCLVALLGPYNSVDAEEVTNDAPAIIINVVYDDSGSMIYNKDTQTALDTWCQAKYSMEVFAAMLGERDTMNVFYMSDYKNGTSADPGIKGLKGSNNAQNNVNTIHNYITDDGDTPFNAVRAAYADLVNQPSTQYGKATQKWLVILTDGRFDGEEGLATDEQGFMASSVVREFLESKASNINVMYLGMGPESGDVSVYSDRAKNIFSDKAETSSQILSKITEICNRIFNSNALSVSNNTITFDIPMGELIVFAQGKDVKINGIKSSSGQYISGKRTPVEVKYSTQPSIDKKYADPSYKNYRSSIWDESLQGSVLVFSGDYDAGTYTLDVTGENLVVDVYYKPNVKVVTYLTDSNGNRYEDGDTLSAGDYKLGYELVRSTKTAEKISNKSKLLDNPSISASYVNGNRMGNIKEGDTITLQDGKVTIDAKLTYLTYNHVPSSASYEIFQEKDLALNIVETPEYTIEGDGITGAENPIIAKITSEDGSELSVSEWAEIESFETKTENGYENVFSFTAKKGDELGYVYIYPSINPENADAAKYDNVDVTLTVKGSHNGIAWGSKDTTTVHFTDSRKKDLVLQVLETPVYELGTKTITNADKPIVVKASMADRDLTAAEWAAMDEPVFIPAETETSKHIEYTVEKTSTPGVYNVYINARKGNISSDIYEDFKFTTSVAGKYGMNEMSADGNGTVRFDDSRSIFQRFAKLFKWLIILLIILIIIAMYVFKPRLPKNMKKKPTIGITYSDITVDDGKAVGSTVRNHKWEPIIPETGTIRYYPVGKTFTPLQVRAIGKGDFIITNWETIKKSGKDIIIGGKSVSKMTKARDIICNGATKIVTREPNGDEYVCHLNK